MIRLAQVILLFTLAAVSAFAKGPDVSKGRVHLLGGQTTKENRIQLVFLADGFTEDQETAFVEAAQDKLDYLLGSEKYPGVTPFREYKTYFAGIALFLPSKERGACHPEKNTPCPDTVFGVRYNQSNLPRLMGMGPNGSRVADTALRKFAPDYDLATVLVNDPDYGGAGGAIPIVSMNVDATEVIAHELMGHSFSHLGDEYINPYPGYPDTEEVNTSKDGDPKTVKWKEWIDIGKILAPFEGAHYHAKGWYRPEENCKMRNNGADFCHVCTQAIVRSIYNKVKPIDAAVPRDKKVSFSAAEAWSLSVTPMKPLHKLNVRWFVNGTIVNVRDELSFTPVDFDFKPGTTYRIEAQVVDSTELVNLEKQDPLLTETREWQLKLRK